MTLHSDVSRAAEANRYRTRDDVEWAASKTGGIYLRHCQANDTWREWQPEPGEIEATHAVVQRAINAGLPMEEWKRLVRNGSITREVRKAMAETTSGTT
jgi:hypothetical protein